VDALILSGLSSAICSNSPVTFKARPFPGLYSLAALHDYVHIFRIEFDKSGPTARGPRTAISVPSPIRRTIKYQTPGAYCCFRKRLLHHSITGLIVGEDR